ncbi:MAG: hypothetical protein JWQ94_3266 [Tardiphaga sp.]|nr:hypothetical protein [Tardiphaga sp.]
MSQQLGIILMIDSAAAFAAGTLDGNIYLIDNAKWAGSSGEGTGLLVTAVDGTRVMSQVDAQVLNWLPYGINGPPPTLPQTFFLADEARRALSLRQRPAEARLAKTAEPADATPPVAAEATPLLPRLPRKIVDILGREIGEVSRSLAKGAPGKQVHYPNPVISNIAGQAVDLRVIYPAQYGSPDLFSDGLYWSATVDTNKIGRFAYTMYITLFRSESTGGEWNVDAVTLPYVAYVDVTSELSNNGFCAMPAMVPA